jgi:phage shock protein C
MSTGRELVRARDDRVIGGVCAGLAHYFGWSPQRMRIGYVVVSILSAAFPGILVYLVLWFLMPEGEPTSRRPFELDDPGGR